MGNQKVTALSILDTAVETIALRGNQHGDMLATHGRIALLWQAYIDGLDGNKPLSPADVANMMALLKVARTMGGAFNVDDYVDAAGYAAIAGFCAGRDAT